MTQSGLSILLASPINSESSLVLPVLGLMLLPFWFGDNGVYLAIPVAEAVTFVLAIILVNRTRPGDLM